MNIAAVQAIVGMNVQHTKNNVQSGQTSENTFGSVFGSIVTASATANIPELDPTIETVSDEAITALLKATTIEELEAVVSELRGASGEMNLQLDAITTVSDLEQIAQQLGLNPQQLVESVSVLLEKAGVSEPELGNLSEFWTMLDTVEKVASPFFKELTHALEGKGAIAKQQAIELLALLKTSELVAPKTDLLLKQEQQVFALQSYLVMAGQQFETNVQAKNQSKQPMHLLMDAIHPARVAVRIDASQPMMEDASMKNGEKQAAQQTIPLSTSQAPKEMDEKPIKLIQDSPTTTNESKESSQHAVHSVAGTVSVSKGEFTVTELENRNQTRNEALIREMQTILKRSNFGQTGGTNRLLIKLYPEHLGQVRIELLQTNGVMTARILASTALGKEMLDSQLHQLRQAFVQQNVQVERIDISQTLQDTARNDREQAFNQHFGRQQHETEQQQEQNSEEEKTFQEYMIELEV